MLKTPDGRATIACLREGYGLYQGYRGLANLHETVHLDLEPDAISIQLNNTVFHTRVRARLDPGGYCVAEFDYRPRLPLLNVPARFRLRRLVGQPSR
jgi:hypothetical protein